MSTSGDPGQFEGQEIVPLSQRAGIRNQTSQAWRDIRGARRGPIPNSRPLPEWVRHLAWVLDDAVAVPGTDSRRVGIDGFLTIIPGIGDAAGLALSMVVVLAGVGAGVSAPTIARMLWNVTLESVIGLIPFGGVVFDMVYKSNQRNLRLIERDLADRRATRRSSWAVLLALLGTVLFGVLLIVVITVLSIAVFIWVLFRLF